MPALPTEKSIKKAPRTLPQRRTRGAFVFSSSGFFRTGGGLAAYCLNLLISLFLDVENRLRAVQEDDAGLSQREAVAATFEERGADLLFQLFQPLAEGWLGDVELLCRCREAVFSGDFYKIFNSITINGFVSLR